MIQSHLSSNTSEASCTSKIRKIFLQKSIAVANSSLKSSIILWELILYAGHTSIPTNYAAIPV